MSTIKQFTDIVSLNTKNVPFSLKSCLVNCSDMKTEEFNKCTDQKINDQDTSRYSVLSTVESFSTYTNIDKIMDTGQFNTKTTEIFNSNISEIDEICTAFSQKLKEDIKPTDYQLCATPNVDDNSTKLIDTNKLGEISEPSDQFNASVYIKIPDSFNNEDQLNLSQLNFCNGERKNHAKAVAFSPSTLELPKIMISNADNKLNTQSYASSEVSPNVITSSQSKKHKIKNKCSKSKVSLYVTGLKFFMQNINKAPVNSFYLLWGKSNAGRFDTIRDVLRTSRQKQLQWRIVYKTSRHKLNVRSLTLDEKSIIHKFYGRHGRIKLIKCCSQSTSGYSLYRLNPKSRANISAVSFISVINLLFKKSLW